MPTTRSRKRPRKAQPVVSSSLAACILWCSSSQSVCLSFTPVLEYSSQRELVSLWDTTVIRDAVSASSSKGGQAETSAIVPFRSSNKNNELKLLPPWLRTGDEASIIESRTRAADPQRTSFNIETQIGDLEYALLERHGMDLNAVREIVQTIYSASGGEVPLMAAIVRFLTLFVDVYCSEDVSSSSTSGVSGGGSSDPLLTHNILLASTYHVVDCFNARRSGITSDLIAQIIHGDSVSKELDRRLLPVSVSKEEPALTAAPHLEDDDSDWDSSLLVGDQYLSDSLAAFSAQNPACNMDTGGALAEDSPVTHLVESARRLKRAEILVEAVLGNSRTHSRSEAARVRDWLLSSMDDWRSLTIRVVASLYRLEGIEQFRTSNAANGMFSNTDQRRRQETVHQAKEAMYVYAPLAERLGLHRLKLKLEESAFRLLYPRQYQAVSSLYKDNQAVMQILSNYLNSSISAVVRRDDSLMEQIEGFSVSSRVKGPFSLWKKLLRTNIGDGAIATSSSLAVTDVNDAIALRVVFQAKKQADDESEERFRAREAFLCYYIQNLIRQKWPEVEQDRMKDYIKYPKPNGYQSLHHTSLISCRDTDFPFEVQVRTHEMHQIAEHGVAAHWDYKLAGHEQAPNNNDRKRRKPLALLSPTSTRTVPDLLQLPRNETPIRHSAIASHSYTTALETAREDLVERTVYVFVAGGNDEEDGRGQLLSMPSGSTVLDVLDVMGIQSSDTDDNISMRLNGRPVVSTDSGFNNGDVLMLTNVPSHAST